MNSIAAQWDRYRLEIFGEEPGVVPTSEIRHCQQAFYGGVDACMVILCKREALPKTALVANVVTELHNEVRRFLTPGEIA